MEVLEKLKRNKKPIPGIVSVVAILNFIILGIIILGALLDLGQFVLSHNTYASVLIPLSIIIIILVISFYGVILLHKGRKKGFYFYAPGVAIFGFFTLYVTLFPSGRVSSTDIGATLTASAVAFLFVIIFATQLKHLN